MGLEERGWVERRKEGGSRAEMTWRTMVEGGGEEEGEGGKSPVRQVPAAEE